MLPRQASLERELQHWDQQVQLCPHNPQVYVRRGMVRFKLAQIQDSIADFDQAESLEPALLPYLWQRGLSYYYMGRFSDGARQFEVDLQVNGNDVEETVWRYLCIARDRGMAAAQKSLLPVGPDPRPVMRRVYDLFARKCQPEDVLAIARQAGQRGLFYAHLYLGLFYEVTHPDDPQARDYIVKAAAAYPLEDYMGYLACVHKHLHGWD